MVWSLSSIKRYKYRWVKMKLEFSIYCMNIIKNVYSKYYSSPYTNFPTCLTISECQAFKSLPLLPPSIRQDILLTSLNEPKLCSTGDLSMEKSGIRKNSKLTSKPHEIVRPSRMLPMCPELVLQDEWYVKKNALVLLSLIFWPSFECANELLKGL